MKVLTTHGPVTGVNSVIEAVRKQYGEAVTFLPTVWSMDKYYLPPSSVGVVLLRQFDSQAGGYWFDKSIATVRWPKGKHPTLMTMKDGSWKPPRGYDFRGHFEPI